MSDGSARTLGAVLRDAARLHGERPALISDEATMNWSELDAEVDRLAGVLSDVGIGPGDVVGALLTKRPEVVTGFLALARRDASARCAPDNGERYIS